MKIPVIMMTVALAACGGAKAEQSTAPAPADQASAEPAVQESPDASKEAAVISTVTRKELDSVLAMGPANVLGMVQTDSHMENGRFVGFRIVSFRTTAQEILGLRPEDVLMQVNGMPIETPDQFFLVFERLKKADHIAFSILRNGQPQELDTPIAP